MRRDVVHDALQSRPLRSGRATVRSLHRNLSHPVVARARAALLVRQERPPKDNSRLIDEARAFALSLPTPVRLQVCVSLDRTHCFIYAWMEPAALGACTPADPQASRLQPLAEWQCASALEEAPYHYVVATDVEPQDEAEFNRWYDSEHMPGLAGVAGTVHCARLRTGDGSPRYHACYDLMSPDVLDSSEWLAARHTAWSTRVRPHFRNPRRIMFHTLLDERRLAVSGAYF